MQTFNQVVKSAIIDGYLSQNSAVLLSAGVSLPKYQKREKKPLSASETAAILNAPLSDKERAFMLLLYYTGLRKGEALALTVNDIDLDAETLTVNKSVIWDKNTPILKPYPKSNNGVRSVPLCVPLCGVLRSYMVNCSALLFPSNTGQMMSGTAYKNMMRSINKKLSSYAGTEINITAHRLRHNFCSLLCYQVPTISTKTIARILGDTEEMVLKVYSHIIADKEDIKGAVNATFNTP
jgi:integrase